MYDASLSSSILASDDQHIRYIDYFSSESISGSKIKTANNG